MKAELLEDGTLRVIAESPIESFALSKWHDLWNANAATFLLSTVERSDFNPTLHPEFVAVNPMPSGARE